MNVVEADVLVCSDKTTYQQTLWGLRSISTFSENLLNYPAGGQRTGIRPHQAPLILSTQIPQVRPVKDREKTLLDEFQEAH